MFHKTYEDMVRYASEGELAGELVRAKAEWLIRTGELFESDGSFERRITAFLEWYVLDRPIPGTSNRPVDLYIAAHATSPEQSERLRPFTRTTLSLFEFRKARGEALLLTNLLSGEKLEVHERRKPAGLDPGDLLEARICTYGDKLLWFESVTALPRECRRIIAKVAKRYRKLAERPFAPVDLVHRVDAFHNRCERYRHLTPKSVFADLERAVFDEPRPSPTSGASAA